MSAKKTEKLKPILPQHAALNPNEQTKFEKQVKVIKKNEKAGAYDNERGVVYIGHIPEGFYEQEMKSFFKQFGNVTKVRISRSKKTGKIKGYGFVEFLSAEVAKIVADTMNNYLMFEKLLKCQFVPRDKLHKDTFVGSKRKFVRPKGHIYAKDRHNKKKTKLKLTSSRQRTLKLHKKRLNKLDELGIHYSLEIMDSTPSTAKENDKPTEETKKPESSPVVAVQSGDEQVLDNDVATSVKDEGEMVSEKSDSIPSVIHTPQGDMFVDDSSDDEITFKTPPYSLRSSGVLRNQSSTKK